MPTAAASELRTVLQSSAQGQQRRIDEVMAPFFQTPPNSTIRRVSGPGNTMKDVARRWRKLSTNMVHLAGIVWKSFPQWSLAFLAQKHRQPNAHLGDWSKSYSHLNKPVTSVWVGDPFLFPQISRGTGMDFVESIYSVDSKFRQGTMLFVAFAGGTSVAAGELHTFPKRGKFIKEAEINELTTHRAVEIGFFCSFTGASIEHMQTFFHFLLMMAATKRVNNGYPDAIVLNTSSTTPNWLFQTLISAGFQGMTKHVEKTEASTLSFPSGSLLAQTDNFQEEVQVLPLHQINRLANILIAITSNNTGKNLLDAIDICPVETRPGIPGCR